VVKNGLFHVADAAAGIAIGHLTTAFNTAAGLPAAGDESYTNAAGVLVMCATALNGNIGGLTLTPGLYTATSLSISGSALTLDAEGEEDAVFIFQMTSTFNMGTGMQIILAGGAQAKNVFWQVGTSANLMANTIFYGTIMAKDGITSSAGIVVNGRLLARLASVTMISATVTKP
jgi:hypothetical protein